MLSHAKSVALGGVLLLAACGGGEPGPPPFPLEGDAVVLWEALTGSRTADDALAAVGRSGGWPIPTSEGFLFALRDGGLGPYRVESPSGAFASATLEPRAGLAWALVPIATPDGATYRFATRFGDPFPDPFARRITWAAGLEVGLVQASAPHLERWFGLGDVAVPARTLRVWVPGGAATHFLYAHDGQNLFTPSAPYGGWRLQDAAGPATLVVGIDNSSARLDEYTQVADDLGSGPLGGGAAPYADFVEATVRPFIEARYGIPQRTGIMGSSLGGLLAVYQALRHPGAYDFVASLSGTLGWGSIGPSAHAETILEAYGALAACPDATFYLDSGGGPGTGCVDLDLDGIRDDGANAADNYCENEQMKEILESLGCGGRLHYTYAPGAPHNEGSWRTRSPAILAIFEAL